MINLNHIPPPPPLGAVTSHEAEGCLHYSKHAQAHASAKHLLNDNYIEVVTTHEVVRPAHSKEEARNAFSVHQETPWQKVLTAYHEEGLHAALEGVLKCKDEGLPKAVTTMAVLALQIWNILSKVYTVLPSTGYKDEDRICEVRPALGSVARVAWHPHTQKVAAVFRDDTIKIYTAGRPLTPLLKHRLQRGITDISWMPCSASTLAVGCDTGVLLWAVDPVSVVTRPSGSCVTILSHSSMSSVASLSWHPKGGLLACVGSTKAEVVVWDVGREIPVVVYSGIGAAFPLVRWSCDGSKLFTAASGKSMKVFETKHWNYERWSLESRVESAVWSYSGKYLLFVTQNDPVLYALEFTSERDQVGGSKVAIQVADFTLTELESEDGNQNCVGGPVQQIAWEPRSERLAVAFQDSELIALFHTHTRPHLRLAPIGFIRGETGHVPVNLGFQQSFGSGALLSVVWSSGEVQHIPLYFLSSDSKQSLINTSFLETSLLNATNVTFNQTALNASVCLQSPIDPYQLASPTLAGLFTSPRT
ncbi:aladin-like [Oratosquilla oratoria]|uniref:aladin-like n=1 Tax=Oratosquilla oratoria TaxID=337810 RepID=UPI003F76504B